MKILPAAEFVLLLHAETDNYKNSTTMKTISTLLLTTLFALGGLTASAQTWTPGGAPHKKSKYYNGSGMDYSRGKTYRGHSGRIDPGFGHSNYYNPCPVSFHAGLVSKRFATFFAPGDRYRENLWGEEGRFTNGLQLGFTFQPTGISGFGLRTGGFYEIYFANGYGVHNMGYNRFTEHDFYFPIDLAYRAPVGRRSYVNVYTGLGFNMALAGVYRSWGRNGTVDYQDYGNYDLPDRANAMWEMGADVQIDHFKLGMTYGLGLNDNEFYDNARTRQNKFTLSAAVVF